ncbi:MAG: methyltransferase family protein [Terriglobia bacterium]
MSRTVPLARWLLSTSVLAALLLMCAGKTNVPMLKIYLAVFAGMGFVTALATDVSQDAERRKPGPAEIHPNSRRAASFLFLVTLFLAALDAGRLHWTKASIGTTQTVALVVLIAAASVQTWAMVSNPFFSTVIRIQSDRGHELVTRGPYRLIRHPGYLAMTIMMPATALVIGSVIAMITAFSYSVLILWRTESEDQFLAERLAGYAEYAARVRYRLIPTLW